MLLTDAILPEVVLQTPPGVEEDKLVVFPWQTAFVPVIAFGAVAWATETIAEAEDTQPLDAVLT